MSDLPVGTVIRPLSGVDWNKNYVWNPSTLVWEPEVQASGGAGGTVNQGTGGASAWLVDTELPPAAALADNTANPTVPGVGAFGLVFDGSTWDRQIQGLTDTQLRATPVPVSGTVTANAGSGTLAVSGPLTDAQLRATAVPVSGTVTSNPTTAFGKTVTYVSVNQGAAGTTELAAASPGNKHKLISAVLTMSIVGTLKFTDGVGDRSGPMDIAATGGFVMAAGIMPYLETGATNRALNIVTTLGAARGVVAILTEA